MHQLDFNKEIFISRMHGANIKKKKEWQIKNSAAIVAAPHSIAFVSISLSHLTSSCSYRETTELFYVISKVSVMSSTVETKILTVV